MANITLDNTPTKTTIADDAIIAIAEGDKLKHITKGDLFAPYVGMINGKVSLAAMNAALLLKVDTTQLGAVNGVATLNSSQKLSGSQRPDATTTEKGCIILGGDLGGTFSNPTVPGLQDRELLANKVQDMITYNETTYPSTAAVAAAIALGVGASYNGIAFLDTDGTTYATNSFWFATTTGTYPDLGDVELPIGYMGIISKEASGYVISLILIPGIYADVFEATNTGGLQADALRHSRVLKMEDTNGGAMYYEGKQFTKSYDDDKIIMNIDWQLVPGTEYLITFKK